MGCATLTATMVCAGAAAGKRAPKQSARGTSQNRKVFIDTTLLYEEDAEKCWVSNLLQTKGRCLGTALHWVLGATFPLSRRAPAPTAGASASRGVRRRSPDACEYDGERRVRRISYASTTDTSYASTTDTSYASTTDTSYASTTDTSYASTTDTSCASTTDTSYASTIHDRDRRR